jgi:hypothetical protein
MPIRPRKACDASWSYVYLCSLQHCFEDFIDCFDFPIGLWVVGGCELMSKSQFVGEFNEKLHSQNVFHGQTLVGGEL